MLISAPSFPTLFLVRLVKMQVPGYLCIDQFWPLLFGWIVSRMMMIVVIASSSLLAFSSTSQSSRLLVSFAGNHLQTLTRLYDTRNHPVLIIAAEYSRVVAELIAAAASNPLRSSALTSSHQSPSALITLRLQPQMHRSSLLPSCHLSAL